MNNKILWELKMFHVFLLPSFLPLTFLVHSKVVISSLFLSLALSLLSFHDWTIVILYRRRCSHDIRFLWKYLRILFLLLRVSFLHNSKDNLIKREDLLGTTYVRTYTWIITCISRSTTAPVGCIIMRWQHIRDMRVWRNGSTGNLNWQNSHASLNLHSTFKVYYCCRGCTCIKYWNHVPIFPCITMRKGLPE